MSFELIALLILLFIAIYNLYEMEKYTDNLKVENRSLKENKDELQKKLNAVYSVFHPDEEGEDKE